MATVNSLATNTLQNIFYYVQQKKETHSTDIKFKFRGLKEET